MDSGGAGRATVRLHKALLERGIDSSVLCLYKNGDEKGIFKFENRPSTLNRILLKTGIKKSVKESNIRILESYPKTYFIFTFPVTDYKIDNHPLVVAADIIHLHFISGFIDFSTFFSSVNKPIVWTIHDKNPTMGGFHLKIDSDKNAGNEINELEERCFNIKHNSLGHKKDDELRVVAPSKFLAEYSSKSKMLSRFKHYHIFNSVDLELFKPVNHADAKKRFDLPNDKPVLLFVSEGIEQYHKGADILIGALKDIREEYVLVTIGRGRIEGLDSVINLGSINDDELLKTLYSAADAALLPSREDNLPNIMLEAMACGTPVIGTPVGGMLDVIKSGFNGLIADEMNAESLKNTLNRFFREWQEFDRKKIREFAETSFSYKSQIDEYMKVYKESAIVNKP